MRSRFWADRLIRSILGIFGWRKPRWEQLPVDEVRLVPTATSPLKPQGPMATSQQRLAMLRLAISGASGLMVDPWETEQDEVSYTLQTVEHFKAEAPTRDVFLVIGADSLASFQHWHEPKRLLQSCHLCVIARGGCEPPDYSVLETFADVATLNAIRDREITMPQIELSSSEIRTRCSKAQSIRFLVPAPVEALIRSEKIYRVAE